MCMPNVHLKKCKKTSQIFTSWCDRRIAKHNWIVQLICRPGIPRTDLEDYPKWMHMFPQRVFAMVMVFDVCLM